MKLIRNHISLNLGKIFIICFLTYIIPYKNQAQALQNLEDSVSYFLNLSSENWHKNIAVASETAQKNYLLSKKTNDFRLRAEATAQYGIAFYSANQYDSALYYYNKAIDIANNNQLNITPFLINKLAVLGKKSEYLNIIQLIDKHNIEADSLIVKLLLSQISASLEIGLTQKADSALQVLDKIKESIIDENNKLKLKKQKGSYYSKIGYYVLSDSILNDVLEKYTKNNNYLDAAEVYTLLAQNAMSLSKYNQSMDYIHKAELLFKKINYKYGLANINLEKGALFSYLNDYNIASDHLFDALTFFEQNGNLNKVQRIYFELGWLHYKKNLYEKANEYADKSLAISRKIKNISSMGSSYSLKGILKMNSGQNDSAVYYHNLSVEKFIQTGNQRSIATVLFNKAINLENIGEKDEALKIYKETYRINKSINYLLGIAIAEKVIGQFYLNSEKLDSAIYYLNKSENRTANLSDKNLLLGIYKNKSEFYQKKNQFKKANEYLNKALELQKEIFNDQRESIFIEIETVYDLKNKEKELAYLNAEKENSDQLIAINKQKIKSQRQSLIALTVGVILLVILIYIIFKYYQIKLKTNKELKKLYHEIQEKQEEIMAQSEELQESNDHITEMNNFLEKKVLERTQEMRKAHSELDKFFYRASHDFRGPLTTMMGLVEVSKLTTSDQNINQLFDNVNHTAKKLDKMVRKLQSVSFLSDFQELSESQPINLKQFIGEITDIFLKEYNGRELKFDIEINEVKSVVFYPNLLKICLTNLIENSIIFNKNDVIVISIIIELENDQLILTVSDNGVGIEKKWQDNIFEMFEKSSDISKGNGLGLYLVKKAVTKLNGEIKLESTINVGSTFQLIFPINQAREINSPKTPVFNSK